MKIQNLTERIIDKLSSNFDIKKNDILDGIQYDFSGIYTEETTKYILSKELVYDSFSSNETVLCKTFADHEFSMDIDTLETYLMKNLNFFKGKKENQMSSMISFIYIGGPLSDTDRDSIKKFKFHKSFLFGIKGWINTKIIYIDITNKEVITNRMGKKDMVFFNSFFDD
ncbi:hypothetical protein NRK67_02660 [Fusobacteria bacterium ZRK30]|nr:hypothetical protein NRK67_02660 [Fusobacteria bacterium ZRK30]